ncbi:MAG TPA: glycoside hydrolase family 3 N-terminal domain-containing protein, partial [Chitinophagaceae bacterium]|nr:glycoside hydrolase family 3 N-terminal domain-containing protein [Chitinophagaceae bacterium]
RSFGEDKHKTARFGVAYMKGMQDAGIMATAKHFPGHGDTEVDSHYDLPVINKNMKQLDTLELYPFKQLIDSGVGSVMIAHLFIPAIDATPNRPTSLSKKAVTSLLREKLDFKGLVFTDALEMKGVTKFFPAGEAAVQALLAGNDMLCLPDNVPMAINAVRKAVQKKRLSWENIDEKLERVLAAKYRLGLHQAQYVDTTNLLADLNSKTDEVSIMVAKNSLTVLRNEQDVFPLKAYKNKKIAYIAIGASAPNELSKALEEDFDADVFYFSYGDSAAIADSIVQQIDSGAYNSVVVGVHNFSLRPSNNFGISPAAIKLWNDLQKDTAATILFGNVYAAKNFCTAKNLIAMYQDDSITQRVAADYLMSRFPARGKLPVTVCDYKYGSGLTVNNLYAIGTSPAWLRIDSIVYDAMARKAFPGCVVLAIQNGVVKYHKSFGRYEFDPSSLPVRLESIYDLASVTKTSATTVALMKLYEAGKIDLNKTLGDYLSFTRGTDKAPLVIKDV